MLIGICGGICAGKNAVAEFLIQHHRFQPLRLKKKEIATDLDHAKSNGTDGEEEGLLGDSTLKEHSFSEVEQLVDFVTAYWQERWVTTDIWDEEVLDALLRRPFFLFVSIDAPLTVRYKRFAARRQGQDQPTPSLAEFVACNDEHLFNNTSGLARLIGRAQVRLINSTTSLASLYGALGRLDLTSEERLRPSWDQYFMQLASLAAQRSNCMKRRVGCVLIREGRVISTGYNGTPRGLRNCNKGGCPRCNHGQGAGVSLAMCLCIHAEENALLEAGRERIREGSTLYCDTCPCLTCSIKIAQVGITEVVFSQSYSMDTETAAVFREAGVRLRQFSPPQNGLVDLTEAQARIHIR